MNAQQVPVQQTSIVIPALNEERTLPLLLGDLEACAAQRIVVDGGSHDATVAVAQALAELVLREVPAGRARQMNAGAARAEGAMLVFLHADTRLPEGAANVIAALAQGEADWGFFRVRLIGASRWLPVIGRLMWWRSRCSGIATGDQGLFVRRELFERVGGFPEQALMEDVEICRRLGAVCRGSALDIEIGSSGRRWDRDGALRTIALMWWLRLRYFLGASPLDLQRRYYRD